MLDQDEFEIPGDDGFGPGTDFVVSIVSILMVMLTLLRLTSLSISGEVDVDYLLQSKRSFWAAIVDKCTEGVAKIETDIEANRRIIACHGSRFSAQDNHTHEIFSFGSDVLFLSDEDLISDIGSRTLSLFGDILKSQHTNIKELQIIGHTDWLGASIYNFDLGWRRAKKVYRFLVEKGSIDPEKMLASIASYGENIPYDQNKKAKLSNLPASQINRDEHQIDRDRRVEITIYYRTER